MLSFSGSGCGAAGAVVASNTRDLQFKSSHRQILFTFRCIKKLCWNYEGSVLKSALFRPPFFIQKITINELMCQWLYSNPSPSFGVVSNHSAANCTTDLLRDSLPKGLKTGCDKTLPSLTCLHILLFSVIRFG